MPETPQTDLTDAPRGFQDAKIDDKGRLKLPVGFQRVLGNERLFATSLDKRTARIYPMSLWEENERMMMRSGSPEAAERVSFLANRYGGETKADAEGRVLLPSLLRKALGLESAQVYLHYFNGAINVYTEEVVEEKLGLSMASNGPDLSTLRREGFK